MEQGEEESQHAAMLPFTGKEDPFPGNEAVVKNQVGICAAWHEPALETLPGPEIMDGNYLFQPIPVARDGEGNGVVLILGAQCPGGHHQHLIGH